METPKGLTNSPNTNQPNIQRQPINMTVVPIRQPPPRLVAYRRQAVRQSKTNKCKSLREENPIEKLIIRGIRSITTKTFEEM